MAESRGTSEAASETSAGARERAVASSAADSALTVERILAWADAHHAAHGAWPAVGPRTVSEPVEAAPGESWKVINHALCFGLRGLPGDSSLAELLAEHRGVPLPDMSEQALAEKIWAWEQEQFPVKGPRLRLPEKPHRTPLTIGAILAWADAFHAAHGRWPGNRDRTVQAAPDQSWGAIDRALRQGRRGLPGGSSLGRLLVQHRGPEARPQPARLTVERILAWADRHYARTGDWPTANSGAIPESPGDTWSKIELALRQEGRGLSGKNSLARLLADHRGKRHPDDLPQLTVEQICAWADAHHAATGRWPTPLSGPIADAPGETWSAMQAALYVGLRGLPGGVTLPQVLADRKPPPKPQLTLELIRTWAEDHEKATGIWPDVGSGPVAGVPGETWCNINKCLRRGRRGLPGGSSLAQALGRRSNPVIRRKHRKLTAAQILAWADAHHAATGKWPTQYSGPIPEAPGERWMEINGALNNGSRGLPGTSSLKKLLQRFRGPKASAVADREGVPWPDIDMGPEATVEAIWAREQEQFPVKRPPRPRQRVSRLPHLAVEQVLAWADAHRAATGKWPSADSGRVRDVADKLSWRAVDHALHRGHRGLPGGLSLHLLLAENRQLRPPLSIEQILTWADRYHGVHGHWPTAGVGPQEAAPGESWNMINLALGKGLRGLPGGSSLMRLLCEQRSPEASRRPPPLTIEQILAWADAEHAATGKWPTAGTAAVLAAPDEHWMKIDLALRQGHRGLEPGGSLARLLAQYRGVRNRLDVPRLSVEQILAWADHHHAATGQWPARHSGVVRAAPAETWVKLDTAMRQGIRGLGVQTLLARVLAEHRGVPNPASSRRPAAEQARGRR
jgi:hypothetical protein